MTINTITEPDGGRRLTLEAGNELNPGSVFIVTSNERGKQTGCYQFDRAHFYRLVRDQLGLVDPLELALEAAA